MNSPLVSVIIPAYNGDRFIAAAIESILQQTYRHFEIIVVNDGSHDRTAAVLQPYFDRIQYVEQQNQGVAAARNHGLQLAQGEFIAFLDQDDVWLPEKLALQVSCLLHHPEVGIVHSGWRLVNAAGDRLSDIEPWHECPELDLKGWLLRMPVLLSAMLFRRQWLEQVGGLPTQYQQACDVDLVQRLALAGCQTAWVETVTVLYRQHEQNDSLNTVLQAQESWAVREAFFQRSDIPEDVRSIERDSLYYVAIWSAWRLYHTNQFGGMASYLEKALHYRPRTKTEAIVHWIELFKQYEAEYGGVFEVQKLLQAAEWQTLMQQLVQPVAHLASTPCGKET